MSDSVWAADEWQLCRAERTQADAVWAFVRANPQFEQLVSGGLGERDAMLSEFFDSVPPPHMPYGTLHKLVLLRGAQVEGLVDVTVDLLARGVWHVGLFQIGEAHWGTGLAQRVYGALEGWMLRGGAQWLRLGVVAQNLRGERFWLRQGYRRIGSRHGIAMGRLHNTVHVMLKPVPPHTLQGYLAAQSHDVFSDAFTPSSRDSA